jgi:NAD(P)-dependent dehydrogenase (short-subunit alcohol dehydrogenase family)
VLLKGKTAVVYGAGGSVGGAVARAFAREGATVFLAGRTRDSLEVVAAAIREAGGTADVGLVDALDGASVDRHVDQVVATTNRLDVSFNAIAVDHIQGVPLADLTEDEVVGPVGNVAVLMASDYASPLTGNIVNVNCGEIAD